MIARREPLAPAPAAVLSDQYVVAFGKSGGLGCFTVVEPSALTRGERVVVRTPRGLELGEVLGPATLLQARMIGSQSSGDLVRRAVAEDDAVSLRSRSQADALFEAGRQATLRLGLALQILDVEVLLDGSHAIVQYVGGSDAEVAALAETLTPSCSLETRFENLAMPAAAEEHEHGGGGCDKPDCGRGAGGNCTTCSTGGGCSSCGAGKVDLRAYFGHLREKMEADHRTPLL